MLSTRHSAKIAVAPSWIGADCMRSLIVLVSIHHKNTEQVAQVIANALGDTTIQTPQQTDPNNLLGYDLVGFGSGIYFNRHDKNLLKFADNLPELKGKKVFIFSTSGNTKGSSIFHGKLREKLQKKSMTILGEFNCPALDTYGLLKIMGGANKGRPNQDDLKNAEAFAQTLKQGS
jgi:flavodoxin